MAPGNDINDDLENAYAACEDDADKPKKKVKQIVKKKVRDNKTGKLIEVEEEVEVTLEDPDDKKGGRRGNVKKNKFMDDDIDYSRNADRTIDPMDYDEDGGRHSNRRGKGKYDIDNGFDDRGRPRKGKAQRDYEDDSAEEISPGKRGKKKGKK